MEKILEKSGDFVSPEKWKRCTLLFKEFKGARPITFQFREGGFQKFCQNIWIIGLMWEILVAPHCLFGNLKTSFYRSGTVNSKSFVGKVFLRIKRKFELTYAL